MTDVAFLAQLAAGATSDRLEAAWRTARKSGLAPSRRSAARTGLLPALGRFLATRKTADAAEIELAAICMAAEERSAASSRLLSEAAAAAGQLRGIAVKASALVASGLYDPGERHATDADLVVRPRDLAEWKIAFESVGAVWELLPRNGYEVATAVRGPATVEIHIALPEGAGRRAGPNFDQILPRSAPGGLAALLVPDHEACREIAVHHFLFHHLGSADHALRVIQDLGRLEDDSPDGPCVLPWSGPSPAAPLALLRRIGRRLREENLADPETACFLSGVRAELRRQGPSLPFSERVGAILGSEAAQGRSAIRAMFAALAPPVGSIRRETSEPVAVTVVRYAARPFSLAARWIVSRDPRATRRQRASWRAFLSGK